MLTTVGRVTGLPVVVTLVVSLLPGLATGQTRSPNPPRTPWGDPDLQGPWNNGTIVPLERPASLGDRETLTDEEVAERAQESSDLLFSPRGVGFYNEFWFEYGKDTNRTSLVIGRPDGRLPALTPEAHQRLENLSAHRREVSRSPSTYLDFDVYARCIGRGLPGAMMNAYINNNYLILQTPDYVVLVLELMHDARIIPLDGRPHPPSSIQQWLGDSRGHWEGDTLVVETTNLTGKVSELAATVFGIGEHLRLVERFTWVDADTIDYRYTVTDPTTYTEDFTVALPMNRIDGPLYEYACHEGNYAMANVLRGARSAQ
jgi:hypothetical protein